MNKGYEQIIQRRGNSKGYLVYEEMLRFIDSQTFNLKQNRYVFLAIVLTRNFMPCWWRMYPGAHLWRVCLLKLVKLRISILQQLPSWVCIYIYIYIYIKLSHGTMHGNKQRYSLQCYL